MPNRKKQILYIIAHVLFWAIVSWRFCVNSFLRSFAYSYWKEIVTVLFIAGMVYLNYFVLIPKLLLKRKRVLFWSCVIILLIGTVAAEMLLVDADMHERMVWLKGDFTPYYSNAPFLLFLRDASFFLFFLMLKLYRVNAIVLENTEKAFTSAINKLAIVLPDNQIQLIDFKDIAYFLYDNDEIVLTLKNGQELQRNGSLSELENLIPSDFWIRANRHNLVMFDSIVRYTSSAFYVEVGGKEKRIPYYSTKQEEILAILKEWNPDLYSEDFKEDGIEKSEKPLSEDMQQILDYLAEYPGSGVEQVAKSLHFSSRTAYRLIAELRKRQLIDYEENNTKERGYIIKDKSVL